MRLSCIGEHPEFLGAWFLMWDKGSSPSVSPGIVGQPNPEQLFLFGRCKYASAFRWCGGKP